jgi:hypothetical protein
LLTKEGSTVTVDTIAIRQGKFKVYNFEVANTHTYYVSPLGILVHNQCGPHRYLKRFGKGPESLDDLAADAARTVGKDLPHGVSTRGIDRLAKNDVGVHRVVPRSEVEKVFPVHKTGAKPDHYTVELPKPITQEVVDLFNKVFPPIP